MKQPVALRIAAALFASGIVPFVISAQKPETPPSQSAGGVQASKPRYRVIRSVSGSEGSTQNGTYLIRDPRTTFYLPQDHHVVVYFEWEGPIGLHHCEGMWKGPEGKTTALSSFDYDAKQTRFGGYWEMLIGDTTQPGLWTFEARVDGEVTGTHTFQIIAGDVPVPVSAQPPRLALSSAEIYQQAIAATVSIDSLDGERHELNTGSGFLIGNGLVLTAFQVIDGAASLRVVLPDLHPVEVRDVLTWNRRQDWAILRVPGVGDSKLPLAKTDSWAIGDHCYFLDTAASGGRVIVSANIVGYNTYPGAGERLNLAHAATAPGIGTALLNDYGEVLGILGGGLIPGVQSIKALRYSYSWNILSTTATSGRTLATPLALVPIPAPDARPTSLADMVRTGQFLPPLVGREDIISADMARDIRRQSGVPSVVDQKFEFAHSDGHAVILVTLNPQQKQKHKGTATLRIYNLDNQLLTESPPAKVDLTPAKLVFWTGQIEISKLPSAIYRLDVVTDGAPIWRTFFQVTD